MKNTNTDLWNCFIEICKGLNAVGITPTLMGSLGLEAVTKKSWDPSDIDIHVEGDPRGWEAPDEERIYHWSSILAVMQGLGYELVDLHEHEFKKEGISVEFGTINSLPEFAGIDLKEMTLVEEEKARFYLPTAEHFLKIYQASSKDSYRNENNNDKDFAKIEYLSKGLGIES